MAFPDGWWAVINFVCANVQSFKNKALSVADCVVTQGIDILALTERWIGTEAGPFVISECVQACQLLAKKVRKVVLL